LFERGCGLGDGGLEAGCLGGGGARDLFLSSDMDGVMGDVNAAFWTSAAASGVPSPSWIEFVKVVRCHGPPLLNHVRLAFHSQLAVPLGPRKIREEVRRPSERIWRGFSTEVCPGPNELPADSHLCLVGVRTFTTSVLVLGRRVMYTRHGRHRVGKPRRRDAAPRPLTRTADCFARHGK